MTEFLLTKIVVSITALLFITYIYFKLTHNQKIYHFEKKLNSIYYSQKVVFLLFIILLIVGLVFYRIEKNVLIRNKTIEEYKFAMALLAYQIQPIQLSLKDDGEVSEFEKEKDILRKFLENKIKERFNKKEISPKLMDCDAEGVCKIVYKKNKYDVEKAIQQELKLFQYYIQNYSIRNAIERQDWLSAIYMLNDELTSIYPNVTNEELVSGFGNILFTIVGGKPLVGFASLLKTGK